MSFWIIATLLACLAIAPIMLALRRRLPAPAIDGTQMQVYKDQLAEVERDLARGTLNGSDAHRTRLEISRRLLDADKTGQVLTEQGRTSHGYTPPLWSSLALGTTMLAGTVLLYVQLGAPRYQDLPLERRFEMSHTLHETRLTQTEAEDSLPESSFAATPDPQHLALLTKLQDALETRPDDLQGHILLADNAAVLGQYHTSHVAQARVIALKGGGATAQDYANYADRLILTTQGYVSPEAERALTQAIALDPKNGTANFYLGEMFLQIDRADLAFTVWSELLKDSDTNAPWRAQIAAQIETIAALAGVTYTPPATDLVKTPLTDPLKSPPQDPLRGPSDADIAAAADMPAEDRRAFIQSMVDQLSSRLANSGGSAQEWAQLISALGVQGDTARARAIWNEAQVVFGADTQALETIRSAAQSAGVAP
jgi:cytochrome c-type biogenesis protein CcmH